MKKKRKVSAKSISNLKKGRVRKEPEDATQESLQKSKDRPKKFVDTSTSMVDPIMVDAETTMSQSYTRHNPSPAMSTRLDKLHDKVVERYPSIRQARPTKQPRTVFERIMLIQFLFAFLTAEKSTLSLAVNAGSETFC